MSDGDKLMLGFAGVLALALVIDNVARGNVYVDRYMVEVVGFSAGGLVALMLARIT